MDSISPQITDAVNFLAELFDEGCSYSSICVARSALSSILKVGDNHETFGSMPCVRRFVKGVFEARPSLPLKSKCGTWDPSQVLSYLESWFPHHALNLKELSYKLVMLLALLSGQRCQTIHSLQINNMILTKNKCTFFVSSLLKHSRKGSHQKPLEFIAFEDNAKLCIIDVLQEYLRRTKPVRDSQKVNKLLLSFQKPFKPISKDTLARWIKTVLAMAGIDTEVFTAHSTRAASTSAASHAGVPISTILEAAGWSQECTFARFYKKHINQNFGQSLLSSYFIRQNKPSTLDKETSSVLS